MFDEVFSLVQAVKNTRPLILNITNFVTMGWVANGLLSLGASPIMTNSIEEIEELVQISQGVVLNIGTLDDDFLKLGYVACKVANDLHKPLILDPVGAGASRFRTHSCLSLLEQFQFSIIRGNASEIMALAHQTSATKGVDSSDHSKDAIEAGLFLSSTYKLTIAITGSTDIVITDAKIDKLTRGDERMTKITGTGCLLTAVVAAFHTLSQSAHHATRAALLFYGITGEIAAYKSHGSGSFQTHFLDALSQLPNQYDYD